MSSTNAWGRGPFDARSVANRLLDEADRLNIEITNLSLQKLLYFSHGFSLLEYGEPLVAGYFEAWDHGPVHPLVYRSFKKAGRGPISFRVEGVDAMTGTPRPLPEVASPQALSLIWKVLSGYTRSSLSILLDISHARGGALALRHGEGGAFPCSGDEDHKRRHGEGGAFPCSGDEDHKRHHT